jgi:1-acyl-sn-glycerol-3-phosphate acyltransferase
MVDSVRQWAGSVLFTVYLFVSVATFGLVVILSGLFGHGAAYRAACRWVDATLWLLQRLCRLDYRVEGRQNLPAAGTIVLIKHASAWEAIAQLKLFPMQTWVLKRELLWAPVLGWVLWLLRPIAIDRSAGRSAVQQVISQGQQRLGEGLCVVIFPEGTRVPAGQTRRYGMSGALLAAASGRPIVPVAHDAGLYWPRRGWLKRAGTIRVSIGAPIEPAGKDPRELNELARQWIEAEMARFDAERAKHTGSHV